MDQITLEELDVFPENVSRPTILAHGEIGSAQIESRRDLQGKIPEIGGHSEGALA